MSGLKKVCGWIGSVCGRAAESCMALPLLFAMGLMLTLSDMASAQAPTPLIPTSPVNMVDLIEEAVGRMGVVVGAAVGAWAVYLIIRKALRWVSRAF